MGTTGAKLVLATKAYIAWELKLPILPSAKEYKDSVLQDYSSLLVTEKGSVSDLKTLKDWEEEKDSMNKWPLTMIMDIGVYLARLEPFRKEGVPFTDRLLSDYKEQKAYSYIESGSWRAVLKWREW